jgi:Uma2 family endonuclease
MAVPLSKLTVEQYLAIERQAEYKSEYFNGEMYAMAGRTGNHNEISARIIGALVARLVGRGCRVYTSDMKVRTGPDNLYTYPDVTVACGKPVFADGHRAVLVNPTVIFEVLSESTEAKDRDFKFQRYKMIVSFEEYVLVSQTEPFIERYCRRPGAAWTEYSEASGLESSLELNSLGIGIPLAEIYQDIEFDSTAAS